MCYMKDPRRFETSSKLMIYSGIGCIEGLPVTKGNIEKIKKIYFDMNRFGSDGKQILFSGFNTNFSGRLFTITDCLLRGRRFFLDFYTKMRVRLEARAVAEGSVEKVQMVKKTSLTGKTEEVLCMKGKKNQSLILWSSQNARRRVARTILHLIHTEWLALYGIKSRVPYPIDYLGHQKLITLDEVVAYDNSVVRTNKKKKTDVIDEIVDDMINDEDLLSDDDKRKLDTDDDFDQIIK